MLQTKGVVLARVLVGLLFVVSGIGIVTGPEGTAAFYEMLGIPMAGLMVWVAAAVKIVGGGLVIVGKRVGIAAAALIVFTIIATLTAHMDLKDPMQLTQALKNLSIIGGLLYVMAYGAGSMTPKKSA